MPTVFDRLTGALQGNDLTAKISTQSGTLTQVATTVAGLIEHPPKSIGDLGGVLQTLPLPNIPVGGDFGKTLQSLSSAMPSDLSSVTGDLTGGLQSLEGGWLSAEAIEAGRVTAAHSVRGEGRLYIRVFPHKSVTAIPAETRMGKGKGEPEYWAAVIKPGMILFEIAGLPEAAARDCLARVAYKMPFRCRLVGR